MRIEIILFNILLLIFLFILIYLYMYINYSNNYEHFEVATTPQSTSNPISINRTSDGAVAPPIDIIINGETENAAIDYPQQIDELNKKSRDNNDIISLICTGYYWFRMPISGPKLIYFITNGKNDDPVLGKENGGKNMGGGPWMLALRLVAGSPYLDTLTSDNTLRFFIRNSTNKSDGATIKSLPLSTTGSNTLDSTTCSQGCSTLRAKNDNLNTYLKYSSIGNRITETISDSTKYNQGYDAKFDTYNYYKYDNLLIKIFNNADVGTFTCYLINGTQKYSLLTQMIELVKNNPIGSVKDNITYTKFSDYLKILFKDVSNISIPATGCSIELFVN